MSGPATFVLCLDKDAIDLNDYILGSEEEQEAARGTLTDCFKTSCWPSELPVGSGGTTLLSDIDTTDRNLVGRIIRGARKVLRCGREGDLLNSELFKECLSPKGDMTDNESWSVRAQSCNSGQSPNEELTSLVETMCSDMIVRLPSLQRSKALLQLLEGIAAGTRTAEACVADDGTSEQVDKIFTDEARRCTSDALHRLLSHHDRPQGLEAGNSPVLSSLFDENNNFDAESIYDTITWGIQEQILDPSSFPTWR